MDSQYSGLEVIVTIGGRVFTADELGISEIKITDSDDGDNEIELTIPDNSYRIVDSGLFKTGSPIAVQWGYSNGKLSQQRSNYILMKPSMSYDAEGAVATYTASTKSATLAARRPQKLSGPTSVKTVISEICNRNGLSLNITGGDERMTAFAHGAWSDREVIRVLADRFGYQATYTSNSLTFSPRDYGAIPSIELVYARGESSSIISAQLDVDAKKSTGDSKTIAVSVDPKSKQVVSSTAGEAPKALAISAEDGHSWLSLSSAPTSNPSSAISQVLSNTIGSALPPDVQQLLTSPDPSTSNLSSIANGEKQLKQKKKGELSVTSIGFINAVSRLIVTVKGLSKRDSGNWYTVSVVHHISIADGYKCEWELSRHGNNAKGTERNPSPLNNQKPIIGSTTAVKSVVAIDAETGKKVP